MCASPRFSNIRVPAPEQHRRDVKRELVDQARCEELLAGSRTSHHRDVLVAGRRAGLLEGGLDAAR